MKKTIKFKVGDDVTCIESNTDRLKIGNIYHVTKVYGRSKKKYLKLAALSGSWYQWRFILTEFLPNPDEAFTGFTGIRISKPQPECKRLLRCIDE